MTDFSREAWECRDMPSDDPNDDFADTRRKCVNCGELTEDRDDDGDPICADCEEMT